MNFTDAIVTLSCHHLFKNPTTVPVPIFCGYTKF